MVAESNPALQRGDSTSRRLARGPRIVIAGIVAAALTGMMAAPLAAGAVVDSAAGLQSVLGLGGADTTARHAGAAKASAAQAAAAAAETTGLHVRVAPTASSTISVGAPVAVSVEIENATGEAVAPGTVRLVRADDTIDDSTELEDWLVTGVEDGGGIGSATVPVAESESRGLAAGGAMIVSFTVPAEAFAELADSAVVGLGAELVVGDTVVASGTDAYPNADVPAAGHVAVALVAPLTAPVAGGANGLIAAGQLENWTGPTGLLTRQLDALDGRQVAIGLDPRILASIRVLGTSAPASATAWLQRLTNVSNEIFPLAYADADLAVQSQLGLPGLLAPTTFSDMLDPANFSAPAADDADGGADGTGAGATPTAEPTEPEPTPGAVPTTEEILEWPYTRTDIAWPADDTVATGDLAFFDAAGLTTAILAPGNVEPADGVAEASATIDASTALVADAGLTAPLREASLASTETEWRAASGKLLAELALDAGAARTTLLATFDRGAPAQSDRVSALIDEIAGSAWSTLAGLSAAIGAPPEIRTLIDEPETEERRSAVGRMVTSEAEVTAFATVLTEEGLLTGPLRRELLTLLDVSWFDDTEAWDAAVDEWLAAQGETLDAVSVVPSSTVNVLSRESPLPTTVQNLLPYPVTVVVNVAPSNGRLIVEDEVEVTIEPESRSTVSVPVAAGVGNGEVTLTVSLSSTTGVPVGEPVDIQANVQADWEGLGAAILATVAVLVFGIGIWRNIRRRRRQRAELAATGSGEADAAASAASSSGEADAAAPVSSGDEADAAPVSSGDEAAPETAGRPHGPAEPTDPRDG